MKRSPGLRAGAWLAVVGLGTSCASFAAGPEPLPAEYVGCYSLQPHLLRAVFTDSLGRSPPEIVRLSDVEVDLLPGLGFRALRVLPTDIDFPPYWTQLDHLPSSWVGRRADSTLPKIKGDSIDVYFPSGIGELVLRLRNRPSGDLSGRAEWVNPISYPVQPLPGVVVLQAVSCDESLVRDRAESENPGDPW